MPSVFVTRLLKNWGIVAKQEYLRKTIFDFEKEDDFLKDATTSMLRQIQVLFQDEHVPYERGRVCARSAERPGVLDNRWVEKFLPDLSPPLSR